MAAETTSCHRAGPLKQQNKRHKTGRHRSKGQLEKQNKGRVCVKTITHKVKKELGKQQRRNRSQQIRRNKREEALNRKRTRGGSGCPPFLVAIVALHENLEVESVLDLLKSCDDTASSIVNHLNVCHIGVPRLKQRFSFICPEYGNLYALLNAAKIADCLLFVVSPSDGIDEYGEHCLTCVFAQGLPSTVLAVQGLKDLPIKKQAEARKRLQKQTEKRFPQQKLHHIDSETDALVMMRVIGNQKLRPILLRDRRPHLLAEEISFEYDKNSDNMTTGTLLVSGYIRGQTLSANGLVHLPGWGNYQMIRIDAPPDPHPLCQPAASVKQRKRVDSDSKMDSTTVTATTTETRVLQHADPSKQTSLQCEVIPDPMDAEQTWPTEEELAEAEAESKQQEGKPTTMTKRVPKGTSEYQAAWIIDSENEEGEGEGDDEEEDAEMLDEGASQSASDGEEEDEEREEGDYETISVTWNDDVKYDETIDMEEEQRILEKLKEEHQDQMFPDEIDTPMDVSASVRFQRYRGLKSFRTSPWDPKENLPNDYARIFQFGNFARTRKIVLNTELQEGAMPGWYVRIHIACVPLAFMECYSPGTPVLLYGLLAHEQRMCVLNMRMCPHEPASQRSLPVRSKDPLVFHVGYQRFRAAPIFSEHTNGNKHKFVRFLGDDTVVATVYAPIIFPPASVLVFREKSNGQHELVATGSLLSIDPDRIVTKKIVLSGHLFKINKKLAVVRYMFYGRDDILWFKPVELHTKWGRRGHIKEPLGTHGHMKCIFDGQLKSQDTVLMSLYKRVFPKWHYEPIVEAPPSGHAVHHGDSEIASELFD